MKLVVQQFILYVMIIYAVEIECTLGKKGVTWTLGGQEENENESDKESIFVAPHLTRACLLSPQRSSCSSVIPRGAHIAPMYFPVADLPLVENQNLPSRQNSTDKDTCLTALWRLWNLLRD